MKNLICYSLISLSIWLPQKSSAVMTASREAIHNINSLSFEDGVRAHTGPDKYLYIHNCREAHDATKSIHENYDVIGTIQHCAVNMVIWKANKFFFFKKNNKTYFRQIKVLESRTFEVRRISGREVYLGRQVELNSVDIQKNYSLLQ